MRFAKRLTVLGLAAMAMACSSSDDPFGPDPDFSAIHQEFTSPTGTFARGAELSIIGGASQQHTSVNGGFAMPTVDAATTSGTGSSSGSTAGMQSLRILTSGSSNAGSWCSDIASGKTSGSCGCPGGGTLVYDFSGLQTARSGGPIDVTLRLHASQCTVDGNRVDGGEYLKLRSSGTPSASDLFMLMVLRLEVKLASDPLTHKLDLDMEYDDGSWWIAVRVDDGFVVVGTKTGWDGATKTGTIYVRDRNASWTCTLTNGTGTCTSNTGETRQVGG